MKLFFDEHLSPRLVDILEDIYPNSTHVLHSGLLGATDEQIWVFAQKNGYVIVSKDSDMHQRSFLRGFPPKVIWIRIGNCTTHQLSALLRRRYINIRNFFEDSEASFMSLS